jgi:ribonuclease HII
MKVVGKIKDVISAPSMAMVDNDKDKAATLAVESKAGITENKAEDSIPATASNSVLASVLREESSDPFILDYLLEHKSNKIEKSSREDNCISEQKIR